MAASPRLDAQQLGARESRWNGYRRLDFEMDGHDAILVEPRAPRGRVLWRARFFDAFPYVDLAMLAQGYTLAYVDVSNLYGASPALAIWDRFYTLLTDELGLAPRVVIEGMSRGGLILFKWAAQNLDKIACLYADAPVCDIRSWPGGLGVCPGSPEDWQRCLAIYGLDVDSVQTFAENPLDCMPILAAAGVPLVLVVGLADETVPVEENSALVRAIYAQYGAPLLYLPKPGVGHHPHSLEDPTPIVQFIEEHDRD